MFEAICIVIFATAWVSVSVSEIREDIRDWTVYQANRCRTFLGRQRACQVPSEGSEVNS